jgi:hypothetical protein
MSEAQRNLARKPIDEPALARRELPFDTTPPAIPIEHNDNADLSLRQTAEPVGFQIPAGIWVAMIACYAVFLGMLLFATGGAQAIFMIVVSGLYVAMFFGTARTMLRQAPQQPQSPLARSGGKLATIYGPLGMGEVATQMLIVPGLIACFGVVIVIIRAAVM